MTPSFRAGSPPLAVFAFAPPRRLLHALRRRSRPSCSCVSASGAAIRYTDPGLSSERLWVRACVWSIIRLIWLRELRDQVCATAARSSWSPSLPVLIYPVAGFGILGAGARVPGTDHRRRPSPAPRNLHPWRPETHGPRPAPPPALAFTPPPPGVPRRPRPEAPPALGRLFWSRGGGPPTRPFARRGAERRETALPPALPRKRSPKDGGHPGSKRVEGRPLPRTDDRKTRCSDRSDRGPLDSHKVDLLLVVPPDFQEQLERFRPGRTVSC